MPALYPDTACPACGKSHDLFSHDLDRHPHAVAYRYTCPVTHIGVLFRPTTIPEPVILPPASAARLTWDSDYDRLPRPTGAADERPTRQHQGD